MLSYNIILYDTHRNICLMSTRCCVSQCIATISHRKFELAITVCIVGCHRRIARSEFCTSQSQNACLLSLTIIVKTMKASKSTPSL